MSLITDTPPLLQPEGSYPFGLNVINSTKDNGTSSISSEPDSKLIYEMTSNKQVIGQIYFSNKILVFSTDNTTDNISILDGEELTNIYSGQLGFNKDHKILGEHRILGGCEDVFYFMDGINPDRYFNLNNIPSDPSLFSMLQNTKEPIIDVTINNTGGRIPSSGTSFLIQYTNLQGDVFDTSEPTISLPVYNDTISPSAQGSTELTQKSATLNISNLDTRFPYIKLVAIHNVEGNYETYQIDTLYPTSEQLTIEYQGPSTNDIRIDNREVQVDGAQYNTSLVSEQVQGRLLRANVQEVTEDYSQHQRLVNNITVLPEIVQVPKSNFSQDPNNQAYTFQSDEVYALSLRFKDTTGVKQPTPMYHIPGRGAFPGELDDIQFNGETYKRFEVENTAQQLNRSIRGMGYYQTNTNYPDITDCEGNNIYGNLAGTPIRHHRMPSRRTVSLENGSNVQSINITLDNVTIPAGYDDYELFYVPRTDSNSTVLDSGYLRPHANGNEDFDAQETRIVHEFLSPRSFLQDNIKGNYFDIHTRYTREFIERFIEEDINGYDSATLDKYTLIENANINIYSSYTANSYIAPVSTDTTTFDRQILNFQNSFYTNNYDVEVLDMYNGVGTAPDSVRNYWFYSTNKQIRSVNNNLESLVYKPLKHVDQVYQGDSFISFFYYIDILTAGIIGGTNTNRSMTAHSYEQLFVESKINYSLLYGDRYDFSQGASYVASKGEDGENVINIEEYNLNQGYNYNSIKSYFPLPLTYDYCNRCRSKNPTRIIYSPQSFQEELSDSYLISNTNDYIDLPANTGPITGLKYKNNRLYVHTTQTTYVLSPNPQYLSTNQLVAQLQTGDFLSIPPQEIIQTDYGYGGLQSKTGTQNNEYGYFWLDGLRGSLNSITNEFTSLSNKGMMNWFKNNTNTNSEVIMAFDPFYHRLITTIHNEGDCQPFHTLSYSLNKQSFTSFHTYNPDFYLNNSTHFYSTYGREIKRHEQDGNYLPIVIEQVSPSLQTQNLISLTYYAEFFKDDQEIIDIYDSVIIYNSNQSSGKLDLYLGGPYDSLFYRPNQRPVKIQDKNSSFSNIWDNSTSSIVTEKPCNTLPYTDKVFVNTRLEGEHYDKPIFKEKYTIARLSYNKNNRVTHYLLQQNKQQSIR